MIKEVSYDKYDKYDKNDKNEQNAQKKFLCHALYGAIALVSLMPAACSYVMEGGLLSEWIAQSELYGNFHVWQIFQIVLHIGTLIFSAMLFGRVLDSDWDSFPVLVGSALYELCPYRICLCYTLENLPLAAAFMLLPLCLWGIIGLTGHYGKKSINIFVTALSGVLDAALLAFCFANGLLGDSPYIFGEFFTGYTYSHMHPGMGIALMISLFTGGWLVFVKREENWKSCRYFAIGGCLSLVLSLFKLHNTSMLFFGLAQLFLCIPGACAIQKCRKEKNKFLSIAIPLMVLAACIGLAVYQGNTLMYARYALIEAQ